MSNKKIKFAVVGCGRISNQHFESIDALDQTELVAVCDNNEERAKQAAEKWNVPYYTDYNDILKLNEVDVISIATPHYLHRDMGVAAARAGKHVIMEKPIAFTVRESQELIDEFEKQGQILFPVLQVRYNPPLQYVHHMIHTGKLGRFTNAALVIRWYRPQEYFDESDWFGRLDKQGGQLFHQGIHYIDILQWLLGAPKTVFAKANTLGHDIESDDFATATMRLKNDTYATVEFSLCTYPRNLECSLSLFGPDATIKIGGKALDTIEIWDVKDKPKPTLQPSLAPNVYAGGLYEGSCPNHIFVYEEVIKRLQHGIEDHTKGRDALNAINIVDAIYESVKQNKEITLE